MITLTIIFLLNIQHVTSSSDTVFEDFTGTLSEEYEKDIYQGTIYVTDNVLEINALANTYAHIERHIEGQISVFETKVVVISGQGGSSWGPGIGIFWDYINSIRFVITGGSYYAETKIGARLIIDGTVFQFSNIESILNNEWIGLKIDLTNEKIILKYEIDGLWKNFVMIAYGEEEISFSVPKEWKTNGKIMVGKGISKLDYPEGTSDDPEDFNYNYNGDLGSYGIVQFNFINLEYSSDTSCELVTETITETIYSTEFSNYTISSTLPAQLSLSFITFTAPIMVISIIFYFKRTGNKKNEV